MAPICFAVRGSKLLPAVLKKGADDPKINVRTHHFKAQRDQYAFIIHKNTGNLGEPAWLDVQLTTGQGNARNVKIFFFDLPDLVCEFFKFYRSGHPESPIFVLLYLYLVKIFCRK